MKTIEVNKNKIDKKIEANPAITTNHSQFWMTIFDFLFTQMVNKSFYSVRLKNRNYFDLRNKNKSNIFIASHCCWWDGVIGYMLLNLVLKTRLYMMIEELHRLPLLSRIGAFSVEKDSPQSSIRALNYASEVLKNPENSLWIFPQGVVLPPDYRPIEMASGVAHLCKKLNGVNIIPVAHRYNFMREDRPEIFIELGRPIILDNNSINRKTLTQYLEQEFTLLLDNQRDDISQGNLDGYEYILKSKLGIVKRVEKLVNYFKTLFSS